MSDHLIWEEVKRTVRPLGKKTAPAVVPPRLRVRRTRTDELIHTLDLHGWTVQEAYETFARFLNTHAVHGSKKITIITGKRVGGKGLIYREMPGWLETPSISSKIRMAQWVNGGGALEITLKKVKR